jgi:ABC-type Fe3+-hydroxamate transport system substrate-binding protein
MNLSDRLVAVSNYDPDREGVRGLPRVGDYQSTDWERLASLRPGVMVTQFAADRLPPGLVQKAADLKIRLLNVPITRLNDIPKAMIALGEAMGEPQVGAAAAKTFRGRLAEVGALGAGAKVRALIVVDDEARGVAGRENYLNDALEIAGGENAIPAGRSPYPSIDREMLINLDPQVIFQLLPDASPQVRARARRNWQQLSQLGAVREGRVHIFTDPWCLRPSQHAAELAERFARALNEARAGGPATQPTSPATQRLGLVAPPRDPGSTASAAHVAESQP